MARIHPGRYTADLEEPVAVFLIGMRLNKLWKVWTWLPVFLAMIPMLVKLNREPSKGMLTHKTWLAWREVMVVQYWESFDHIERFARSPDDPHLDAWARFNKRIGASGDVGIWHETYVVQPGATECVYGNMPEAGLPAATDHVPADGARLTARDRLGGQDEQGPPLEPPPA